VRISDVSIRNPVFAWMLMSAMMIFGAISFSRMGVSQLPDVDFPVVSISINLEGAAPEIMETNVVDPIEDGMMSLQGVRTVSSSSKQGSASVTVEFELEKNIDIAVNEIQTKLAQIQRRLPKEIDPPSVSKTNPDDQPIMWLAVYRKTREQKDLSHFVRNFIKDQFSTVSGVGDVFLGGYIDPNLRIWVKPEELKKRNMTVNDIIDSVRTGHVELPGGLIDTNVKVFNVRTMGEAKSVEEFGNIVITSRAGQQIQNPFQIVRLKDVADVEEGLAEVTRKSRFNGEPAIGVGIRKQKGSNAVDVAKRVKEKLQELRKIVPPDINLEVNFDSTLFVEEAIHELNFTLILSAILTAIACWVFLGSWTATLNVIMAIPTSILGAFIPLYFMGFTLNTFTLLGLSLSIGIVVDDAIMVLENIFRHNEMGKTRIEAAIVGAREITFAAVAATVAIVAIFLPVAFMKGVIGKFFLQFGFTITFAVLLSLVEALTITPMRSAQFVSKDERKTKIGFAFERLLEFLRGFYQKTLDLSLQHRWKVVFAAVAFMMTSFVLLRFIGKEFSPPQDQSLFLVRMTTPAGSALQFTDEKVMQAEKFLTSRGEVKKYYLSIGGFGGGPGETNSAMMFVTMKPKNERPIDPEKNKRLTQQEFMDVVRSNLFKIKDLKPIIQDLSARGFTAGRGFPVEFKIQGQDWDKLHTYTEKIIEEMNKTGLMTDADSNYLLGSPEIQITPDRKAAAMHGISVQTIGQTVNSLIGGVLIGQYPKEGQRYDIRVQIKKGYGKVEEIKNLMVGNSRANLIPLSQVVTQDLKQSLQSINRIDRRRAISVFSNLATGASQQAAVEKIEEIGARILPTGYNISFSGSSQTFKETFQSLIFALVLGLVVAYMVLATQFNSFIDPISVLVALPFSVSGAFVALLIFGQTLNLYSMIGLILLMGIVKKNSILLVEFTNVMREREGIQHVNEALSAACPIRLRPILMTSFATIIGALPAAIAFGPGAETRAPMAIAIIGGVFVSTLLTLYVVPSVYSLLARLERRQKATHEVKAAFASVGNAGE
jgi:multidrug efflux pump